MPERLRGSVREAVEKYPDRPAIKDESGEITYRELDQNVRLHCTEILRKNRIWAGKKGLPVSCVEEQENLLSHMSVL